MVTLQSIRGLQKFNRYEDGKGSPSFPSPDKKFIDYSIKIVEFTISVNSDDIIGTCFRSSLVDLLYPITRC